MPTVKRIESKDNPLLVRLRKRLNDPAAYRKTGEVVLEGDHLCSAYLERLQRGGFALPAEVQALISDTAWTQPVLGALARQVHQVSLLPDELMKNLSSLETPAPLLFVLPWPGARATLQPHAPTVVLDRLQDAGNVGTVLRSAAAFGFKQVLALKGTAALWSPKVLRAGMGAHFGLNLREGLTLSDLEGLTVPLLGTSSHSSQMIHSTPLPWPCAWVMGHEGQGISDELLRRCHQTLTIAQPGGEESLNVGAAAAVCLYESARQRLMTRPG